MQKCVVLEQSFINFIMFPCQYKIHSFELYIILFLPLCLFKSYIYFILNIYGKYDLKSNSAYMLIFNKW